MHGVNHSYGTHRVLDNAALLIPAGELVCLLGPSGCGKTTLLRLAAGLEKLQEGTISVDGKIIAEPGRHVPPQHRGIGLMFQDYALFPHLSVIDNVTFGLKDKPATETRRRAMGMLDQVGMTAHAAKYPHMLSGGQQQRVALARALAPDPKLLLLDEPFSGLDTNMRARIREETLAVLRRSGVATLMVTHDPEEAMFMADRIKVLGANGRILQAGRPHDIYYHPQHEFVAKLFGRINRFGGIVAGGHVETPLGPVAAPGINEGDPVEVLIRAEGVVLETNGQGTGRPVEIVSTHLLGHDNIARVRVVGAAGNGEESGDELYVRIHHTFEPELSKQITARIDPEYAFVFPMGQSAGESVTGDAAAETPDSRAAAE
jgi:iron(III) transport system ATP-binding protein